MVMDQVVYSTRVAAAPASLSSSRPRRWRKYSGDGHDHWHVQEMMRYDMWGGGGTLRGAKVGFCFLDCDPY